MGHRWVINRRHRDVHRGNVAVGLAVVGMVGEAILTAIVEVWCVVERAITAEVEGATGDIAVKYGR